MTIRDRVVELRRIRSADLIPNPANWRRHPPEQVDALRGVLAQIGFADVAIGVETDDGVMLIDGHVRTEEADDDFEVPTIIVDLDESEADLLLASLDPIASMANTDPVALAALIAGIDADNDDVQAMLDRLAEEAAGRGARTPDSPDEFPTIDPDSFSFGNECPRCGFEFDA